LLVDMKNLYTFSCTLNRGNHIFDPNFVIWTVESKLEYSCFNFSKLIQKYKVISKLFDIGTV
jgi:hypothetical protein